MKLLIDCGNSRLKWGFCVTDNIIDTGVLLNSQLNFATLVNRWQDLSVPTVVAISCVNSSEIIALIVRVADFLWCDNTFIVAKSVAFQCGVRNAYVQPEKLGIDRWLSLIAVHSYYRHAACIVDCGTAITVDLIDVMGQHQGGVICPGLALMKQALAKGTYQLPASEHEYVAGLADNTEAAIYNGALFAACGLIERIISSQGAMQLILTGGDAQYVAAQLAYKSMIDDNLVLRGLSIVAELDSGTK